MKYQFLPLLVFLFHPISSHGQAVRISDFNNDPSIALITAMKSQYDTLIIDNGRDYWEFSPTKIRDAQNKVIIIEEGVQINAKKNAFKKTNDALFQFIRCKNITFLGNGALLRMNKSEYIDGEWRHGISLRACNQVNLRNFTIEGSGGDGIYIAGMGPGTYSENIIIDSVHSLNNKRQGLSIISAVQVRIQNSTFSGTVGALPGAGLDIEPNNPEDKASQISIENCIFKNNNHAGIMIALGKLRSSSSPVSINISNCVLESNHAPSHPRSSAEIIIGSHKDDPVGGEVVFENCLIENSKWGLFYSRKRADAFLVKFINCTARNICTNNTWPPIFLEVPDYRAKTGPLGGYTFKNLYIETKSEQPFMVVRGSRLGTLENVKDIRGEVTIIGGSPENYKYINYDPKFNEGVDLEITRKFH